MGVRQLYHEIDSHLTQDSNPSAYLNEVSQLPAFARPPFTMLNVMKSTRQSPIHHPEGSVWNHTMLVIDEAARVRKDSKEPREFMWAALLHDIGKPATTKAHNGKITSYDHEKVGAGLAKTFLSAFTEDQDFIRAVCGLVRYHMQILHVVQGLAYADLPGLKRHTDIEEVALLGLCDRLGRADVDREKEQADIRAFLEKCSPPASEGTDK